MSHLPWSHSHGLVPSETRSPFFFFRNPLHLFAGAQSIHVPCLRLKGAFAHSRLSEKDSAFNVSRRVFLQAQLRAFIPEMLKYSTGRGKPGWGKESCKPVWWPEDIPWANVRSDVRTEEQKQRVRFILQICLVHNNSCRVKKENNSCFVIYGRIRSLFYLRYLGHRHCEQ